VDSEEAQPLQSGDVRALRMSPGLDGTPLFGGSGTCEATGSRLGDFSHALEGLTDSAASWAAGLGLASSSLAHAAKLLPLLLSFWLVRMLLSARGHGLTLAQLCRSFLLVLAGEVETSQCCVSGPSPLPLLVAALTRLSFYNVIGGLRRTVSVMRMGKSTRY
jgi:hypothetical protein